VPLIKSIILQIFNIFGLFINFNLSYTISHLEILYNHVYLSYKAFLYYYYDIFATNNLEVNSFLIGILLKK